jgi:GNAT superfamily N-acetyltransferase
MIEDAAGLAVLLRGIGYLSAFKNETEVESIERVRRHLSACLSDDSHTLLVAQGEDRRIDGYISAHWLAYLILVAPEGYISELFVDQRARGSGLGGKLLNAIETDARKRGCSRLSLLNMRERESYMRGFYVKHGWEERPDAANMIFRIK